MEISEAERLFLTSFLSSEGVGLGHVCYPEGDRLSRHFLTTAFSNYESHEDGIFRSYLCPDEGEKFIEGVRSNALHLIKAPSKNVRKAIVSMVDTTCVNACTVLIPSTGRHAILVDRFTLMVFPLMWAYSEELHDELLDFPELLDNFDPSLRVVDATRANIYNLSSGFVALALSHVHKDPYAIRVAFRNLPEEREARINEDYAVAIILMQLFLVLHEFGRGCLYLS